MDAIARISKVFSKLDLETRDVIDLTETVGEIDSKTIDIVVSAASGSTAVQLLDRPVTFGTEAALNIAAELVSASSTAGTSDAFGDSYSQSGPAGTRPAILTVVGRLGADVGGSTPVGGVGTISASLVTGANCEFRQVTPVFASDSVATALTKCVATARLPGPTFGLGLAPGQSRSFRGRLAMGLDAKVSGGTSWKLDRAVNLFSDAPHLQVAAEAAVSAALGLAFDEAMTFTAGKSAVAASPVRLRAERSSTRRISLGAAVAVRVETNAGSVLAALLDHVFDLSPVADTLEVFRKVAALESAEGWQQLRDALADSGAERFVELVEDPDWIAWGDERILNFIEHSQKVVKAWGRVEELDGRLRGWMDEQIAAVGLAPGSRARTALGRLAALEPDAAELGTSLANAIREGDGTELLTLLELLTGRSLEQLVARPLSEIQPLLGRAIENAKEAEDLLEGLGDHQIDLIGRYLQKSGIANVVSWLKANATSVNALQGAMSKGIRKVVSRLINKAWEQIDESDLDRIQTFATRVAKELENLNDWRDAITEDLGRIDRGFGFRFAIEVSRVTTEEALLDLEISESDPAFARIADAFGRGRIGEVLRLVGYALTTGDDQKSPAILVRECALVSRSISTSALTSLFQAFGIDWLSTRKAQLFFQSSVTVPAGGVGRSVFYSAGAEVSEAGKDGVFAAGIEFGFKALGSLDIEGSFTRILDGEIRLSVQIEDTKADPEELEALDAILGETGLKGPTSVVEARQPGQNAIKFALEITLEGPVSRLAELFDSASSTNDRWTEVVLRAGSRWVSEPLITASESSVTGVRAGSVMQALLSDAAFAAQVAAGTNEARQAIRAKKRIKVASKWVALLSSDGQQVHPALTPLVNCVPVVRGKSLRLLQAFRDLPIQEGRRPSDVLSSVRRFSRFAGSMTPNDTIRNPMLGFWILWYVLSEQGLRQRGIATCRFSEAKKDSPWMPPLVWTL